MQARNSTGRQVSLLNDDPPSSQSQHRPQPQSSGLHFQLPNFSNGPPPMAREGSNNSHPSSMSSPRTPGLMRADSYDSNNTNDPRSPITPVSLEGFGRQGSYTSAHAFKNGPYDPRESRIYDDYPSHLHYLVGRPSYIDSRSSSCNEQQIYGEESYENEAASERGGKRYPCRFRDSHGCDKTFTTSGHASRHSKIHTAEKAVPCTHPGCPKKFTRADNMKQHLETHNKERSRSTPAAKPTNSRISSAGAIQKARPLADSRSSSRSSSRGAYQTELPPLDPSLYSGSYPHATDSASQMSPASAHGTLPLMPRPMPLPVKSNGLEFLAMAAECAQN